MNSMHMFQRLTGVMVVLLVIAHAAVAADTAQQPRNLEVEVRTPLIAKYLPNYKIVALLQSPGRRSIIVRDSTTNKVATLDENWVFDRDRRPDYYRAPSVSDFIATIAICANTDNAAVEVVQLVEDIAAAPNAIECTMFNQTNYHLFDGRTYTSPPSIRQRWSYSAQRSNDVWTVSIRDVGPLAMIPMPPRYHVWLTEGEKVRHIRKF